MVVGQRIYADSPFDDQFRMHRYGKSAVNEIVIGIGISESMLHPHERSEDRPGSTQPSGTLPRIHFAVYRKLNRELVAFEFGNPVGRITPDEL